jgi:hypothetical protein
MLLMAELFDGLDDAVREARDAAEASGHICRHCGEAIKWSSHSWSGYFHIVSLMAVCGGNRSTYAEL